MIINIGFGIRIWGKGGLRDFWYGLSRAICLSYVRAPIARARVLITRDVRCGFGVSIAQKLKHSVSQPCALVKQMSLLPLSSQRAQYPLNKEYTSNHRGLTIMI